MILEDTPGPAPVRVLYTNNAWTSDATEELKKNFKLVRDCEPEPEKHPFPFARMSGDPVRRELGLDKPVLRKPLPERPKMEAKPRVLKPKRVATRKSQPRMEHVTVERIMELQAQGLTGEQIGKRLGCERSLVYKRLREFRNSSPENSRADAEMRICPCGRRKLAYRPQCSVCNDARYSKNWRNENKERYSARQKAWRDAHPDHERKWREKYPEKYQAQLERHNQKRREARNKSL